jgi:glycosyltransferase involved in cell wall biosynthesis
MDRMTGPAPGQLPLSIIILAKDEASTIEACLAAVQGQSLLARPDVRAEILVVANGCTDDTAARARAFLAARPMRGGHRLIVHDLPQGGKSRSWNRAVHEFSSAEAGFLVFLDSDVTLAGPDVMAELLDGLVADRSAAAWSGFPVKDTALKPRKSLLDWFSLRMSQETRYVDAICGSLYVIRAEEARQIWLPDATPGEDGFLDAMIKTHGFSRPADGTRVRQIHKGTHFFEDPGTGSFLSHERRMFVGTMVNRWLFEHFNAMGLSVPAGPMIAQMNAREPLWVEEVIARNARRGGWLIHPDLFLRRFRFPSQVGWLKALAFFPLSLAATLVALPSAVMANRLLKQKGAADHW